MRNVVVTTDRSPESDSWVGFAARLAAQRGGAVVIVAVLPGSLIGRGLSPSDAGKQRRAEEDRARAETERQAERVVGGVPCDVVALFGDVISDTILVARNLGADAIVVPAGGPDTAELIASSPIPVVTVPPG